MSWQTGNQEKIKNLDNFNDYLLKLEDDFSETESKILLAKFLRHNIGFMLDLFAGVKLLPIQEIIVRSILLRDSSLIIASRGFSKSYLAAILCLIFPLVMPGSKTAVISVNFRSSRRILENVEKIINSKKASLLKQAFSKHMSKIPDMYRIIVPDNGSEVFALPLSPGLRGTRSSVAILDEGLMLSKEIQEVIIRPFLTNKSNLDEEMEIFETENELLAKGIITDKDRISFPKNKFIIFSSASYRFEYLYELYTSYIESIINPSKDVANKATYFVVRASYEALPENSILDTTQINAAKVNGGEFTDYFKREYLGLFSDSSDSYFNIKKLHSCTIRDGDFPTTQIKGDKDTKYLLAIDPSYAQNLQSDFFAMGLYALIPQNRSIVQVHSYGTAGKEIVHHYQYLTYLLTYFNVVYGVIDASGDEFIKGYNESVIAKEKNLKLNFLDVDFESDNYLEELSKAKTQYNITSGKIMYAQKFQSEPIRRMNEHLQNQISAEKVWFASRICSNTEAFNRAKDIQLPYKFKDKNDQEYNMLDFLEDQDIWIKETKAQCALIEVKSSATGILQYDLPNHIKRQTGDNRPRRDNYTTLLIGTYAAKHYFDMMFTEVKPTESTFTPFFAN